MTQNPFAALKKDLPPELIKRREGYRDRDGNPHYVDYVEWHAVADILDNFSPGWSHQIKSVSDVGEIVTVIVAVTVDGITREGIGTGAAGTEAGIKKAEHDALKRAAVKFGVGRELYKKEIETIERLGAVPAPSRENLDANRKPQNPCAKGPADFLTSKQRGMIFSIAREKNIDLDGECWKIWGDTVAVDDLSKIAASWLIEYLQKSEEVIPEVRTGIPSSSPTSDENLRTIAKTPAASPAPFISEETEELRRKIIKAFEEIKQPVVQTLASFDAQRSEIEAKKCFNGVMNFIIQEKRLQIVRVLDNYEPNERAGELARFGINNGIKNAAPALVEAVWRAYRAKGLF